MPAVAETTPRSPSIKELISNARSRALRVSTFNSRLPSSRRLPANPKSRPQLAKRHAYATPSCPLASSHKPSMSQQPSFAQLDSPILPKRATTKRPCPPLIPPKPPKQVLPVARQAKRAPRKGSIIRPSPWRPHIAAEDRLFGWDTPYGQRHRTSIRLPRKLLQRLIIKILGGLAPGTKTTYGAGLLRFTQFCDHHDIPEEERMPASYVLLAAFNAEVSGTVAGGTARSWMAGIRSWHVFHHAPWHGDDEWVKLTRSCVSKEGVEFEKPPRAPVSMEHLVVLRDALDLSRPFDAAVWAVALVTFFGCRRLGETVVTDTAKFSPRYHVTRTEGVSFRTLRNGTKSASFKIPWTKTTKEKGAPVTLTARPDGLAGVTGICPIAALRNHLEVNDSAQIPTSASLFAYRQGTSWTHMSKEVFLKFVYAIWKKAKLQYVSGHSFRIGGAVELLLRGVPPEVVAATGGWTSLAFLLYWRKVEEVLPLGTSKAYEKSRVEELADALENYRISKGLPTYLAAKDVDPTSL